MNHHRIIRLVSAAATGQATMPQLRELADYSLAQLLIARRRHIADRKRDPRPVPTVRLVRALHTAIHAFLSQSPAAQPAPHHCHD